MSSLQLGSHLSAAFDEAVQVLSNGLPENRLILSGGTILQAIWAHRTSTDLDFFIPGQAMSEDAGLRHDRMRIAAQSARKAGHEIDSFNADSMRGRIAGVKFSVGMANWMHLEFGRSTVQNARVQAADIEEVFIGKIHGRLRHGRMVDGFVPIRDLYDMTVCMRQRPEILQHHFRQFTDDQVQVYAKRLRRMPANWHRLDEDRIIRPTYAVDLHGIPQRVGEAVERRDASFIPVAEPSVQPSHGKTDTHGQSGDVTGGAP